MTWFSKLRNLLSLRVLKDMEETEKTLRVRHPKPEERDRVTRTIIGNPKGEGQG